MNLLVALLGLLFTFNSVQYEIVTLEGTEVVNEKTTIQVYTNKICIDKDCYYINFVDEKHGLYKLSDGSNIQFRETRVVYRSEYDTRIYYQKKMIQ